MSYVRAILALMQVLSWVTKELDRRGVLKEGERKALLDGMQKETRDVEIALKARSDARRYNELNPDRVRDDDEFRRPD